MTFTVVGQAVELQGGKLKALEGLVGVPMPVALEGLVGVPMPVAPQEMAPMAAGLDAALLLSSMVAGNVFVVAKVVA